MRSKMIQSDYSLIHDAILEITDEEWDEAFQEEYKILGWKILKEYSNCSEIIIFFETAESRFQYQCDFNIDLGDDGDSRAYLKK